MEQYSDEVKKVSFIVSGTRWNFVGGAQRDTDRHLINSMGMSLSINPDSENNAKKGKPKATRR